GAPVRCAGGGGAGPRPSRAGCRPPRRPWPVGLRERAVDPGLSPLRRRRPRRGRGRVPGPGRALPGAAGPRPRPPRLPPARARVRAGEGGHRGARGRARGAGAKPRRPLRGRLLRPERQGRTVPRGDHPPAADRADRGAPIGLDRDRLPSRRRSRPDLLLRRRAPDRAGGASRSRCEKPAQCEERQPVHLRTGTAPLASYLRTMIRSAPPAPFKTAVLTLLIAVVIAVLIASG